MASQSNEGDFYSILGINKNSSQEDIGKAYRKLVKIHHPDRFDTSEEKNKANAKMQKINQAYQTLSNQKKRQEYDNYRRMGGHHNQYQQYSEQKRHEANTPFFQERRTEEFQFGHDFRKFFDQFFEFSADNDNSHYSHDKTHVINYPKVEVTLTITEWYNGTNKTIKYKRKAKCQQCQTRTTICPGCKGMGYTVIKAFIQIQTECNRCKGTGKSKLIQTCGQCKQGVVSEDKVITIQIPACCQKRHIIEGVGDFNGTAYNNLEICVLVLESETFKVEGQHIKTIIKIGIEEFIYGTKLIVNHLNKERIQIELPPLNTENIIIKNKGFTNNKESHLIITIRVINNTQDLPVNKRTFISQFKCSQVNSETHQRVM